MHTLFLLLLATNHVPNSISYQETKNSSRRFHLRPSILNNLGPHLHNLIDGLNLNIHNPQQSIPMFTLSMLNMPLPPLGLLLNPHRLSINPEDPNPALKKPLINIRRALQSKVTGTNRTGPIKPQHIAGLHIRHKERQAQVVTRSNEVGSRVQVRGYIVRLLSG